MIMQVRPIIGDYSAQAGETIDVVKGRSVANNKGDPSHSGTAVNLGLCQLELCSKVLADRQRRPTCHEPPQRAASIAGEADRYHYRNQLRIHAQTHLSADEHAVEYTGIWSCPLQ